MPALNCTYYVKRPDRVFPMENPICGYTSNMWHFPSNSPKTIQKREKTGVKYEKTHSLNHEHILSGILRCPLCGSGMYGNLNRKKKRLKDWKSSTSS